MCCSKRCFLTALCQVMCKPIGFDCVYSFLTWFSSYIHIAWFLVVIYTMRQLLMFSAVLSSAFLKGPWDYLAVIAAAHVPLSINLLPSLSVAQATIEWSLWTRVLRSRPCPSCIFSSRLSQSMGSTIPYTRHLCKPRSIYFSKEKLRNAPSVGLDWEFVGFGF